MERKVYRAWMLSKRRQALTKDGLESAYILDLFLRIRPRSFLLTPYQQHCFSLLFQLLNNPGVGVG